jgi:hypothetical protein
MPMLDNTEAPKHLLKTAAQEAAVLQLTTEAEKTLKEPPNKAGWSVAKKQKAPIVGNKRKRILPTLSTRNLEKKKEPVNPQLEKKKKPLNPQKKPVHNEKMCHAGISCRLLNVNVSFDGNDRNGTRCCKCQQTFHLFCLWEFDGDPYCLSCYKDNVVSKCDTETLFEDLFGSKKRAKTLSGPKHTERDLIHYVDNFFKNNTDFEMTMQQFYKWMQEMKQEEKTKPAHKEEKKQWVKKMSNYYYTKKNTRQSLSLPNKSGYYQQMAL